MGVSDFLSSVLSSLKRDVIDTVGSAHISTVDDCAVRGSEFMADQVDIAAQLVIDEVQQQFHDTRVDTTWPTCPLHGTHPLWFNEGWWRCDRDGLPVAKLGHLGSIQEAVRIARSRRASEGSLS